MNGVVDEIEVLDALTLHPGEGHIAANLVVVDIADPRDLDTAILFRVNGAFIGWLSAKKLAKLALNIKTMTVGD